MCEALAMVVLRGELDRDLVGRFFRDAFMELRPQARSFVWQGWQSAIAMLGLSELRILVKRAFDRSFIDPQWIEFDGFLRDLEWAMKRPGEGRYPHDNEFTLFGDTIDELSRWYGFSDEAHADCERRLQDIEAELGETGPYRNPFKGVGRNHPCPCGSGKKFKNCCLGR
jgi:uncharacterized protein